MSVKKVFAIIGIVMGCVTAFVGGVLGVMAAMGKFKTPVVKPEKIYFENPEQVVVAQYKDDDGKDVIYSFMLKAENKSIDYEVNVKDCFVWFESGIGEDLIELCDKDGNPLEADSKKRYTIKCNEKVYYKFKEVNENVALDPSREINGKVVLKARTADELHNAEQDLVIWVDRNITSIFLNYGTIPVPTNEKIQEQRINVGKDCEIEFDYIVNPKISWQPISKESKKIVELYYDDPKTEDFVLVNPENIQNEVSYSLYKIFDKTKCYVDPVSGETKLTFVSSNVTNGNAHYFKLAIFPSYNARAEFLADKNNLLLTNVKRLESMVTTDLYIQVVNTSVDKVSMSDGEINLSLYTSDNSIYLNNDNESNNLRVEMESGGEIVDIRLNEVDFNAMTANRFYGNPEFVVEGVQAGALNEIDFSNYNIISYIDSKIRLQDKETGKYLDEFDVLKSIKIGEYDVVDALKVNDKYYYCSNGVMFINDYKQIKLLTAGSYLDFYIYDAATDSYAFATEEDLKYQVTTEGSGVDKQWKIVVESVRTLDDNESLKLGLLVSNNDGKFIVENLFATKPVSVNEEKLAYNVLNSSATLDLLATKDGFKGDEGLDFTHFFDVYAGTYNACVLVISEDYISNSVVKYINAYFVDDKGTLDVADDKKYYIVGDFDNDKFVNKVKVTNNESVTKLTETKLKLLQLTNSFGETAEQVIDNLYVGKDIYGQEFAIEQTLVQDLINETITIKQNLLVDETDIFEVSINDKEEDFIYSGTSGHIIKITTPIKPEIITRVFDFYAINIDSIGSNANEDSIYILNNYPSNARIVEVSCVDNVLTLKMNIGEMLSNDVNVEIGLANIFANETSKTLFSFKILSSAPSDIVYYYNDDAGKNYITLGKDEASAPSIKAKITWNNDYVVEWFVVVDDETKTPLGDEFNLNSVISEGALAGFQDPDFKIEQGITYEIRNGVFGSSVVIEDTGDEKILAVNKNLGEPTYLSVIIADVRRYLKIELETAGFNLEQVGTSIEKDTGSLSDIISYTYDDNTSDSDPADNIYSKSVEKDYITLTNFSTQYLGGLTLNPTEDTFSFKNSKGEEVFNITKSNWVFTRTSDFYSALSVMFDVVTKTNTLKNVKVTFEQDIVHELNAIAWGTEPKLYEGTKIQLYEIATDTSGEFEFDTEPLIKIRDKGGNEIKIKKETGVDSYGNKTYTDSVETLQLSSLGDYKFAIFVSKTVDDKTTDILIKEYSFTVIPNIVVKQNTTENLVLNSGAGSVEVFDTIVRTNPEYELKGYVKLYQYTDKINDKDLVYGATQDENNKIILYSTDYAVVDVENNTKTAILVDKTSDLKNSITMQSVEKTESNEYYIESYVEIVGGVNTTKIKTDWIDQIGEEKEVEVVVKSGEDEVGTFKAIVKNNFIVETKTGIGEDKVLNIKAMTNINEWLSVSGFTITEIKWQYSTANENKTFEISTGDKYIIPALNVEYENVTLVLTFEGIGANVGKTLTFIGKNINNEDITINIIPYELEASSSTNKPLSEREFNVLTDVYNISSIGTYYKYIKVLSVKDKDGNSLTSSNLGYAYNYTNTTDGLSITFNKISDDSVTAFIEYEVQYEGGLIYTYTKEITLENYQDIQVQYPEVDDEKLVVEEVRLTNYVTGNDELYTNVQFEPVLVNANNAASINLLEDGSKFVNRMDSFDRKTSLKSNLEIESLVVLAYQNSIGLNSYIGNVANSIDERNGVINFPKTNIAFSGVIVFRLTSKSGNYEDYAVYVTGMGNNTTNSANVTGFINVEYVDSSKTIADIVNDNKNLIDTNKTFENKFKVSDLSAVNMYLLNATTLADNNAGFNNNVIQAPTAATVALAITNSVKRYTEVKNCKLNIADYTNITLSLIYEDDRYGYIYPIGILTLYLRPTGAVTTITGYTAANDAINNGEFELNIGPNKPSEAFPSECSIAEITIEDKDTKEDKVVKFVLDKNGDLLQVAADNTIGGGVVEIGGSALTIKKRVTSDYKFTVFYTYGSSGYTIKVTYTYKAVEIKTAIADKCDTVGELITGATDADTKFDNTVVIDADYYKDHFGDYQGQITIGGATFIVGKNYTFKEETAGTIANEVTYSIVDKDPDNYGKLVLTFTQGLYDEEKQIDVEYVDLNNADLKTQTYTFNVLRGVEIETNANEGGVVSGQRKTADLVANSFTSPTGSQLTITKTPINGGVKYNFAGYTIYVKGAGELEFNFAVDIGKYALSDTFDDVNKVYKQVVETDDAKINFVHLAQDVNLDLTFTISDGAHTFKLNETNNDVRNLYLTLPKTYLGVEAVYTTKEATVDGQNYAPTAENIVKGTTISDFVGYLFSENTTPGGIKNAYKLKLKKLNQTYLYSDFSAMGFVDSNNPNFLTFTIEDGGKISYANSNAGIALPSAISANETCKIYLSNIAGMSTFEYNIQIMADTKVDGITFSDAGFVGDSDNDKVYDYMSFVIKKDDDKTQNYNTGKLLIGTIKDGTSKGVWVKTGTGNTAADWKFLPKAGKEEQRTAKNIGKDNDTDNCYDIILEIDKYDNTRYSIYMIYYRNSGTCLGDTTIIKPIIHGTSGYILDGEFSIVLVNATVKANESRETGIYGGEKIDLTGKVGSTDADRLTLPDNAVLSVKWNQSRYGIDSLSNTFNGEGANLVTFAYEGTDKDNSGEVEDDEKKPMLTTYTVGEKILIDLVLEVQISGYYVNSITYQFQLDRSVQFFFNAEKTPTGWVPEEIYEYRTNFVMTNSTGVSGATPRTFPLEFSFGNTYSAGDKKTVGNVDYFSSLNWMIKDVLGSSITVDISKNPNKLNPDDETFTVSNTGIIFKKDYNGEINLLLEVLFTNGTSYSVNWKINVLGILKVNESITTNNGNLSNGTGYNSGDKVNLINSTSGGSAGLYVEDMISYLTDTNKNNVNYSDITSTIEYAIVKYDSTDGKTNAERFNSVKTADIKTAIEITDSNNTNDGLADKKYYVQLPVVPSVLPGSTDRYLVIFKVDITYLGKPLPSYYVAYKTVNFLNISVVEDTVDVDPGDDVYNIKLKGNNINVNTRLNETNLDLFGYTETYTYDGKTYKIYLVEESGTVKYKVKVDGGTAEDITINDSPDDGKLNVTYSSNNITLTNSTLVENYYKSEVNNNATSEYTDDRIDKFSMFKLSFGNITEFKSFIDTVGYIEIKNCKAVGVASANDYKFNLVHIADGRWGVNLAEKYAKKADGTFETTADTTNKLFSNKLEDSDFVIVGTNSQPIYTLKSYNDLPENGFRMYTSTMLSAKGSKLISDLFVPENVTGYTIIKDYEIVGVYGGSGTGAISSPQAKWVTNADPSKTYTGADVSGVEIKVPTGTGSYITYTLQEVEYSGSGGVTDVCDVKQKFYVLHCADHASVYRMNANTTNMIKYNQGQDTIVDLNEIFVKFANNTTSTDETIKGRLEIVDASVTEMKDESKNVHTGLADYKLTITDNKITMAESDLIAYKNANPTKNYVTVYYSATFDGKTLKCGLTYQLPSTTT